MTTTTTTTTPSAAELEQGLWTYERWPEGYATPIVLVGTVDPYDHDDYDATDDDAPVLLVVIDAPSGAGHWSYGVPSVYYVRPESLRPAHPEECAAIADRTDGELYQAQQRVAELTAAHARYEAAYVAAWQRDNS